VKRRPRTARLLRWTGAAVCGLLIVAMVACLRWSVNVSYRSAHWDEGRFQSVAVESGALQYLRFFPVDIAPPAGLDMEVSPASGPWRWRPWWFTPGTFVVLPLWLPLVIVGVPTSFLWYRARPSAARRHAGLCPKCGYDRRGIDAARPCPECGAAPTAGRLRP
jgi:hypothetical protein